MTTGVLNPSVFGFQSGFMNLQACNQPRMIVIPINASNSNFDGENFIDYDLDMTPIIDQKKIDIVQGMIFIARRGSSEVTYQWTIDMGNGMAYTTREMNENGYIEMHRPLMVNNPPNIKVRLATSGPIINYPGEAFLLLTNVAIQPWDNQDSLLAAS